MPDAQFKEFAADIVANGQRQPIKLWQGQVIDGRHRLRACTESGLEPVTEMVEMEESALPGYVLSLNTMRNHLTPASRAMYAAEVAGLVHGSNQFQKKEETDITASSISIQAAADAVGVHSTTVDRAKKIKREAAPEVTDAIRKGSLSLHAAREIISAVPEKADQPAALKKVLEAKGTKHRAKTAISGGRVRRSPKKNEPREALIDRALMQVETGVSVLDSHGKDIAPSSEMLKQWLGVITRAMTSLRRFRSQITQEVA
jgi:hypothetical protein